MGKWFLTDYSATVGRILMTFSRDPHAISIQIEIEIEKKSALEHQILQIMQILPTGNSITVFMGTKFYTKNDFVSFF